MDPYPRSVGWRAANGVRLTYNSRTFGEVLFDKSAPVTFGSPLSPASWQRSAGTKTAQKQRDLPFPHCPIVQSGVLVYPQVARGLFSALAAVHILKHQRVNVHDLLNFNVFELKTQRLVHGIDKLIGNERVAGVRGVNAVQ